MPPPCFPALPNNSEVVHAYHLLVKTPAHLTLLHLSSLAPQKGWYLVEVMEVLVEFFHQRQEISFEQFTPAYQQAEGDLLQVMYRCLEATGA